MPRLTARPARRSNFALAGRPHKSPHLGFTLVEVLTATAITLLLMAMVVTAVGSMSRHVSDSRAMMEVAERIRAAEHKLQKDLEGQTAPTLPPLKPEDGFGYLEIIEGPIGPSIQAPTVQVPIDDVGTLGNDQTVGDIDDVLAMTVRSPGEPFIGRFTFKRAPVGSEVKDGDDGKPFKLDTTTIESPVAEVIWFMRGPTLYRRVLLVKPNGLPDFDLRTPLVHDDIPATAGFYNLFDLSVHQEGGATWDRRPSPGPVRLVPNTLADLTKRENRYGHQPFAFPHDARWGLLGMPTLRECSHPSWPFPLYDGQPKPASGLIIPTGTGSLTLRPNTQLDLWNRANNGAVIGSPWPWTQTTAPAGAVPDGTLNDFLGPRIAEDVILTNVIGFDVKVWDPGARLYDTAGTFLQPGDVGYNAKLGTVAPVGFGAYVDLGYASAYDATADTFVSATDPLPAFHTFGNSASQLAGSATLACVYDTWSTSYESDGLDQDGGGLVDEGTDGIDNDDKFGVDDLFEHEAPPPYPAPGSSQSASLRGIQIKIRMFEPDSRRIREVTVTQKLMQQ